MQNSVGQNQIQTQSINPKPVQGVVQNQAVQQTQTSPIQAQTPMYYCPQPAMQSQQPAPNYAGVNIQIFNPSVATPGGTPVYNVNAPSYQAQPQATNPSCYPSNYYTQQFVNPNGQNNIPAGTANTQNTNNTNTNNSQDKKTEKRQIVQLTDDYIKNLENYLNSQDKEVRMMGAKEVIARLQEDDSRKDDLALNALINKMLQDPYTPIKVLALGALDSRIVTGDDYTVGLLKNMQNSTSGYGQDALQAANILLKMSGQTAEKEFEVKDNSKDTKSQSKG